jgi:dodecin
MSIHLLKTMLLQYLFNIYSFIGSMAQIANVLELVGSSDKSWEDATQVALTEATKTIRGITGIELTDMTARVDPNTGKITEYHSTVKIAFGVEHS